MEKTIIEFGDIEIKKPKFYRHKGSNKVPFGKKMT